MLRLGTPLSLLLLACAAVGCRGWTSEQPPVHLNPNMDTQPKIVAYRAAEFFADDQGMRQPVDGTVARTVSGQSQRDRDLLGIAPAFYGATLDGVVVNEPPPELQVDDALLTRGRERYNIYCSPCHAQHGTGDGLVAARLTIKPPSFHTDAQYQRPLGHFFRVATHGYPLPEQRPSADAPVNMPSYAAQIPPRDRWAIALYIRALQRTTRPEGLPEAEVMQVGTAGVPAAAEGASDEGSAEEAAAHEGDAEAAGGEQAAPEQGAEPDSNDPNEAAAAGDEGQE